MGSDQSILNTRAVTIEHTCRGNYENRYWFDAQFFFGV